MSPAEGIGSGARVPEGLVEALNRAGRILVLTGAGVSAESGIPTFRQAQSGLWAKYDPMALASPEGFESDPATVWRWYQWRRELVSRAEPNPGHVALARLQEIRPGLVLVTQNVDGLHQAAGAGEVLELHGNLTRSICSRTGRVIDAEWLETHAESEPPPSPHHARGLARPDVVWFGETLDVDTLEAAFSAARECQLCLVAGTAGAVEPAASLPRVAAASGAAVADINPEASGISHLADWHLEGTSAEWLPRLTGVLDRLGN